MNFSISDIELTTDQQHVMASAPNIVIKGAAGTGKTLICILKAGQLCEEGNRCAIIISTKALKSFIQEALSSRLINNCFVFHQFEWFSRPEELYDYIIVDEAQDFSVNLISRIRTCAKNGIYILGDSRQKVFDKTFYGKEPTATIEEISERLKFDLFEMKKSIRITKKIANFISAWSSDTDIADSLNDGEFKPSFIQCASYAEQLGWIVRLITGKEADNTVGIFLETNHQKILVENGVCRPGISELYEYLVSKNVSNIGYKINQYDNLQLRNRDSVNILTFHSAKGLEFDNVIIPFFDSNFNHRGARMLNYVGFTRAVKNLTFLYTGSVAANFPIIENRSLYSGIMKYRDLSNNALRMVNQYNEWVDTFQEYIDLGLCTKEEINLTLDKVKNEAIVISFLTNSGFNEREISLFFKNNPFKSLK